MKLLASPKLVHKKNLNHNSSIPWSTMLHHIAFVPRLNCTPNLLSPMNVCITKTKHLWIFWEDKKPNI